MLWKKKNIVEKFKVTHTIYSSASALLEYFWLNVRHVIKLNPAIGAQPNKYTVPDYWSPR